MKYQKHHPRQPMKYSPRQQWNIKEIALGNQWNIPRQQWNIKNICPTIADKQRRQLGPCPIGWFFWQIDFRFRFRTRKYVKKTPPNFSPMSICSGQIFQKFQRKFTCIVLSWDSLKMPHCRLRTWSMTLLFLDSPGSCLTFQAKSVSAVKPPRPIDEFSDCVGWALVESF